MKSTLLNVSGTPFSASEIAGDNTRARSIEPKRSSAASQPPRLPGVAHDLGPPTSSSSVQAAGSEAAGDRPMKSSTWRSRPREISMRPIPPALDMNGSTTFRVAPTATAASRPLAGHGGGRSIRGPAPGGPRDPGRFRRREGELAAVRHPLGELLRLGALDLRGRQPLPAPHRHLAQLGHDRRPEPMGPADDLAGPPGAGQIAGEQGAELHGREAGGLSGALTLTQRRQRHVEMSDESSRLGEDDLAVAEEIDQRPRCDHADTVRRPASSAISIAAPSTSPVIPATPAAKNRVTTSALATETTTTTIPSTRSATMATTRAIDSAIGAARAPTPAPNAAPCPSDFAGANRRASRGDVARATTGTTSSA